MTLQRRRSPVEPCHTPAGAADGGAPPAQTERRGCAAARASRRQPRRGPAAAGARPGCLAPASTLAGSGTCGGVGGQVQRHSADRRGPLRCWPALAAPPPACAVQAGLAAPDQRAPKPSAQHLKGVGVQGPQHGHSVAIWGRRARDVGRAERGQQRGEGGRRARRAGCLWAVHRAGQPHAAWQVGCATAPPRARAHAHAHPGCSAGSRGPRTAGRAACRGGDPPGRQWCSAQQPPSPACRPARGRGGEGRAAAAGGCACATGRSVCACGARGPPHPRSQALPGPSGPTPPHLADKVRHVSNVHPHLHQPPPAAAAIHAAALLWAQPPHAERVVHVGAPRRVDAAGVGVAAVWAAAQWRRNARPDCPGGGECMVPSPGAGPSPPTPRRPPADQVLGAAQVAPRRQFGRRDNVLGAAGHGRQLAQRALAAGLRGRAEVGARGGMQEARHAGPMWAAAAGAEPRAWLDPPARPAHLKGCQCTPLLTSTPSVSLLRVGGGGTRHTRTLASVPAAAAKASGGCQRPGPLAYVRELMGPSERTRWPCG